MMRELALLGMQGTQSLQLKAAPCKLRVLSFLAREIIAARLLKSSASLPSSTAVSSSSPPSSSSSSSAAPLPISTLSTQLAAAAQALSFRVQAPPFSAAAGAGADMSGALQHCLSLLRRLREGGRFCSALQPHAIQQHEQLVDEVSREMRGEYVTRFAPV
jgi:hypothetical protein